MREEQAFKALEDART